MLYTNEIMYVNTNHSYSNLLPIICENGVNLKLKQEIVHKFFIKHLENTYKEQNANYIYFIYDSLDYFTINSILIGIIYIERVLDSYRVDTVEDFLKFFYATLVVSSKYQCDYAFDNAMLEFDRVPVYEINYYETILLSALNYDLIVNEEEYNYITSVYL